MNYSSILTNLWSMGNHNCRFKAHGLNLNHAIFTTLDLVGHACTNLYVESAHCNFEGSPLGLGQS